MSVIGPRPEWPEFNNMTEKETPYHESRDGVKAGIARWVQVS